MIETKREDFYFQLFDEQLNKLTEPLALTREEIAKKLKNHQTSFIGDGVERLLSISMGLQIKYVELSEIMNVDALFAVTYQKYFEKTLDFSKPLQDIPRTCSGHMMVVMPLQESHPCGHSSLCIPRCPHRFRHTFATNMLDNGMPIQEVRILMGHTNIDTTQVYAHTSQERVKNSYARYA